MVSVLSPGSRSVPNHPITPIKRNSRTLYCFGGNSLYSEKLYVRLAAKMSPYFVGPITVGDFLFNFIPFLSEAVS